MSILLWLLWCVSFLGLFWTFIGYWLFILLVSRFFRQVHTVDEKFTLSATVIIPSYNEEKVIEKKILNTLELEYPKDKLKILVVDSGSTDKTCQILKKYEDKGIKVIAQPERKGKSAALIYAMSFVDTEVVIMTDANAYINKEAADRLIKHFSDPKVGIVGGRFFVKKVVANAEAKGTNFFRNFENFLRKIESLVDSSVSFSGELYAIRRELVSLNEYTLLDDFEICLNARKKGYRLLYEPDAYVFEYAPYLVRDVILQRTKVIAGTIISLWEHRTMLFNPKYGFYGLFILPGHKLFQVLTPLFLLGIFFSSLSIYISSLQPALFYFLILQLSLLALGIVSIVVLKFWPELKFLPFSLLRYFFLLQYSCILSYINYFKLRKTGKVIWEKMDSSRI